LPVKVNEIDETVLPSLTHETLKELGVTAVGRRLKLLSVIAAKRADCGPKPDDPRVRLARLREIRWPVHMLVKVENAVTVEPPGEFELKGIRRPLAAYNVSMLWSRPQCCGVARRDRQ
jgi:SAM domain (Sterile alpha motif)